MDIPDDDSLIVSEDSSPVVQRVPFKGSDEDSPQVPLENDTDAESIINEKIEHMQSNEPQISIRAIIGGLIVGSVMCFSNMYFGLQTGWVTMGSLQSTLLGFGAFALMQKVAITVYFKSRGTQPTGIFANFGPLENVLLQTTAVATATMPLAGGFVGIIPALNMLPDSEKTHLNLSSFNLLLWGLSIAFFGVFFAVPLRKQTILKEKLKFPSGTATAEMIRVLHKLPENRQHLIQLPLDPLGNKTPYTPVSSEGVEISLEDSPKEWAKKWRVLLYTFLLSALYTFLSYFIPILSNLPIFSWFGLSSLTTWNWTLTPSLSYVGQGMIMGTRTGVSMLVGAVLGWAVLGPIAQQMGWASGSVNNWETGAKGWILWVSLSIMLSEALVSLFVLLAKTGYQYYKRVPSEPVEDPATEDQQVPKKVWVTGLIVSSLLCIIIVTPLFHMPIYEPFIAVLFALLVSVLAVRALGETDLNPVSGVGKVSQIVFAVVAPGNIVSNLIAGAIAEAGAQQAGDMMQDLKTGHLLKASPKAQFIGQLIGSLVSVFVSVVAFHLYTSAYEIPGPKFGVPTAQVWIDMARLVNGGHLATNVMPFCVVGAIIAGALPIIETFFPKSVQYLPSGIAAAIAMYVTPNWTLARVIGSFIDWFWYRRNAGSHRSYLIIVASGFVLGEGVMSIFTAIFKSAGVGVWTCAGCAPGFCSGCA